MKHTHKPAILAVSVITSLGLIAPTFAHPLAMANVNAAFNKEKKEIKVDLNSAIKKLRSDSKDNERRLATIQGVVSAKNIATDGTGQLSITVSKFAPKVKGDNLKALSFNTVLAVNVTSATQVRNKNGEKMSASDIMVNDQVSLVGRMNEDGMLSASLIQMARITPVTAHLQGTLLTLPSTTAPTTFTITVKNAVRGSGTDASVILPSPSSTVSVQVDSATELLRLHGGKSNLAEFSVGDNLVIKGTFSSTSVFTAKSVRNESIQEVNKKGIITGLDGGTQTLSLNWTDKTSVKVTSATVITLPNNVSGSWSSLTAGQTADIKGTLNTRTNILTAATIKVLNQNVLPLSVNFTGTVVATPSSTSPTTLTLTLTSALSPQIKNLPEGWRKFISDRSVSIVIDTTAALFDRMWNRITVGSIQAGDKLEIGGQLQTNGTVQANFVKDLSMPRQ